jgi:outer membrane protein OmpU
MSAGFAAADVAVSGDARMGVISTDGTASFTNRARIKFSGSGTTDGGLAFGASFRAHEAAAAESTGNSGSVFISGAFGKITMGSVDSGDAASVGQLAGVGLTSLSSGNSINYSADAGGDNGVPGAFVDAGGAKVLYTYTGGALTLNASSAQLSPAEGGATAYGIGGSYAAGALTVGVGYGVVDGGTVTGIKAYDTNTQAGQGALYGGVLGAQSQTAVAAQTAGFYETSPLDASVTDVSLSASYVVGATTIKAIYQAKTIEASAAARTGAAQLINNAINLSTTATSMGLSAVHKIEALTLTAYGINTTVEADADISADKPTVSRYGIGFGYDLGGGASVMGGWATVDAMVPTAVAAASSGNVLETYTLKSVSHDQFDLGVSFSF